MARLFDDAVPHYLQVDTPVVTGYPFVFDGWFNSNDLTINQAIIVITDVATDNESWMLQARGGAAGDPVELVSRTGGVNSAAATTTGYSANTWHHACGIGASATDRRVLIDNGSKGTNTTSSTPSGLDRTNIGARRRATPDQPFSGLIAEAAIWDLTNWPGATNAAKADNFEALALPALAKAVSPLMFPLGLLAYWPLIGRLSPEINVMNAATNLTVTGATVADHPKLFYPSGLWTPRKPAVVAAGVVPIRALIGVGL